MPTERLTPTMLTIRLKHHKSTAILAVQPTTPFRDIKAELLNVLRLTNPSGSIPSSLASGRTATSANASGSRVRIPASGTDVLLARPRDPLDASLGWVSLFTSEEELEAARSSADADANVNANATAGAGANLVVFETPKAAGLKDGAVLAFKFRSDRETAANGIAEEPEDEDMVDEGVEMGDDDNEDDAEDASVGERWDVVLPSFEDPTGVVNEGDVGATRNYTG